MDDWLPPPVFYDSIEAYEECEMINEKDIAEIKETGEKTHDEVIQIKTVLLGANGDKGLVGDVNSNKKEIKVLSIIVWYIVGSGILGGGVWGIASLITSHGG